MARMYGKLAVRCAYGCCRVAYSRSGRKREVRAIKRNERNNWKNQAT